MANFKIRGEGGLLAKIGRRNMIIALAILLIGGAVALNYFAFYDGKGGVEYGSSNMGDANTGADAQGGGSVSSSESYFSAAQLSRQQARDEALEVLQTVLASADALEETKEQALSDISRIALEIEKESNVEALVRAKGYSECVAVINGESASVIVKSEGELVQSQVAQINEIVYEQTGIHPANIKILVK